MKYPAILFIILLFISGTRTYSQGCNDAGLCSMGDLDGKGLTDDNKYNTQLSYFFGLGEQQSFINTIQLEQRFAFLEGRGLLFIQLPFHYIYGNLGQTYGIGDVSLGFNYTYIAKKELTGSFLIAGKLPSNDAGKTIDGKGAPMVYQTSLGTYDLALGANIFYKKWQFGLGYLKPFGSNGNYFNPSEWPDNSNAEEYTRMRDLARGDDGMLRVNRFFHAGKNSYNVGLLALYRMQKDKVSVGDDRMDLDNSDGLTLNINLGYKKELKNKDAVTVSFAAPLITREVRVDGLTRTFVLMFTYAFGKEKKADIFKEVKYN